MGKVTVGALTGGYEATRFKEDAKPSPLASVEVLGLADEAAASAAVSTGTALAAGTMMARCDPGATESGSGSGSGSGLGLGQLKVCSENPG